MIERRRNEKCQSACRSSKSEWSTRVFRCSLVIILRTHSTNANSPKFLSDLRKLVYERQQPHQFRNNVTPEMIHLHYLITLDPGKSHCGHRIFCLSKWRLRSRAEKEERWRKKIISCLTYRRYSTKLRWPCSVSVLAPNRWEMISTMKLHWTSWNIWSP